MKNFIISLARIMRVFRNLLVFFLTNSRIPGEKAHSIQIVRTCKALSKIGCTVYLASPRLDTDVHRFKEFYGFQPNFSSLKILIPPILLKSLRSYISFFLISLFNSLVTCILLLFLSSLHGSKYDIKILYVREPLLLLFTSLLKPIHRFSLLFEIHRPLPSYGLIGRLLRKALNEKVDVIVTISNILKSIIMRQWDTPSDKVCVAHSCVEESVFLIKEVTDLRSIRTKLGLPSNVILLVCIGHLYRERNVEKLIDALKIVVNQVNNVKLVLIGGPTNDVLRLRKYVNNNGLEDFVILKGLVKPYEVKYYVRAADIVIIPPLFNLFMSSPITLFEYMICRKPIIAPDIPSIREVVKNRQEAILYGAEMSSLAKAIINLIRCPELAKHIADNAYKKAINKYTHLQRAHRIITTACRILAKTRALDGKV